MGSRHEDELQNWSKSLAVKLKTSKTDVTLKVVPSAHVLKYELLSTVATKDSLTSGGHSCAETTDVTRRVVTIVGTNLRPVIVMMMMGIGDETRDLRRMV
uniref:Uncharacterized protein n=1 Tax=Hyaloperonospora arabidopsidis (strain Emoy2) TaxID=559515 RepID=M4BNH0_HYAAE